MIVANFERLARGEAPTIFGDGEQSLDYVFIDDTIAALLALALPEHDGKTLNIASGHGITVNALTAAMVAASGSTLEPRSRARRTGPPDRAGSVTRRPRRASSAGRPTRRSKSAWQRYWDWMRGQAVD